MVDIAGETGLRAGWDLRAPRITWLNVAVHGEVVEKGRKRYPNGRRRRGGRRANIVVGGAWSGLGILICRVWRVVASRVTRWKPWPWIMGNHSVGRLGWF